MKPAAVTVIMLNLKIAVVAVYVIATTDVRNTVYARYFIFAAVLRLIIMHIKIMKKKKLIKIKGLIGALLISLNIGIRATCKQRQDMEEVWKKRMDYVAGFVSSPN